MLQEKKKKKKAMAFFFLLWSCSAAQRSSTKKATAAAVAFFYLCGATLQRNSMKKATVVAITFFCLLWNCVAAQLHEEGDSNCHRLLLSATELRCSAAPQRKRRQLPSPSSVCCGTTLQRNPTKKASCRRLLPAVELRYSAAEEGDSAVELRYAAA